MRFWHIWRINLLDTHGDAVSMQIIANVTDRLRILAESLKTAVNRFRVSAEDSGQDTEKNKR